MPLRNYAPMLPPLSVCSFNCRGLDTLSIPVAGESAVVIDPKTFDSQGLGRLFSELAKVQSRVGSNVKQQQQQQQQQQQLCSGA